MTEISDRYRRAAAVFTEQVEAVPEDRWTSPSPCDDWDARGVVEHMASAHNMFLGFVDQSFEASVSTDDDPLAAWLEARDAMVAALEDPAVARTEYDSPFGRSVFEESADQFVTNDLLVHSWDLATAVGNEVSLDPAEVEAALAAYQSLGDNVRNPRVFGPAVPVPDDANAQAKLLAFTGRDPNT